MWAVVVICTLLSATEGAAGAVSSVVGLRLPSTRINSGSVTTGPSSSWLTNPTCDLGRFPTYTSWCVWRFENVSIPRGATITTARLSTTLLHLPLNNNKPRPATVLISLEASNNSAPLPLGSYEFGSQRSLTSSVTVSLSISTPTGSLVLSGDVSAQVGQIISGSGWNYGNALSIYLAPYNFACTLYPDCALSFDISTTFIINYTFASVADRVSSDTLQAVNGLWNTAPDGSLKAVSYGDLTLGISSGFAGAEASFFLLSMRMVVAANNIYLASRNATIPCTSPLQSFVYPFNFTVECDVPATAGNNWSLQTTYCWDIPVTVYNVPPVYALFAWIGNPPACVTVVAGYFDFPTPVLLNSTLIPYGHTFAVEAGTLTPNTTSLPLNDRFTQIVVIGTQNVLPSPNLLAITVGPQSNLSLLTCPLNTGALNGAIPPAAATDPTYIPIACVMPSCSEIYCPGLIDYHVTLTYDSNNFVSFDTLTYPTLPIIVGISGCQDKDNGTVCPAIGGRRIVVHLQADVSTSSISVLIGGASACTSAVRQSFALSCTLPPGTGIGVATVVVLSGYTSLPAFFLSYAPPRIDDIIGGPNCTRSFSNGSVVLEGCDRAGSTNSSILTMFGANFGTGTGMSILMGSVSLVYENNNDSVVYFYLAPGFGDNRELTVSVNGQAAKAFVGYSPCPAGMDSNCVPCAVGRYGERVGGFDTCQACPAGQYQPTSGQTTCLFCSKGFFQPAAGSFDCLNCPVSMTSLGVGSSQLAACFLCPTNFYLAQSGADLVCNACPSNSVPTSGSKACMCGQGFYDASNYGANFSMFDPKLLRCVACPLGADCNTAGSTEASLVPLAGWWRSSQGSFYTCLKASNCPAAITGGSNQTTVCALHRSGVLCSTCDEGYQDTASGGECTSCDNSGAFLWVSIVLVLLAIGITGAAFWYQRHKHEAKMQRSQMIKKDTAAESQVVADRTPLMPSAKLVVGFLQVVTSVVSSFLVLPSIFVSVMSVFAFINFDFVPWASIHCLFGIGFYTKIYVACIYPIAILGLLLLFVVVPIAFINKRDFEDENTARLKRRRYLNQAWTLLLFCLFLLYPWITLQLLQFGICLRVENDYFLMADFTQKCFEGEWLQQLSPVIILFLLIPVGVPLTFGVILWRSRTSLRTAATRERLGFLYASYSASAWWFELFDMAYKVALISVVRFFDREVQAPIRMGVCYVYIVVVLISNPFLYTTWDFLSLLCAVEVLMLSLLAHVLPAEGAWQGTYVDVLLSLILLFLVFMVVVYFCSLMVRASRYLMRHPKVRKLLAPKPIARLRMATQFRGHLSSMESTLSFDAESIQEFSTEEGSSSSNDSTMRISSAMRRTLDASGGLKVRKDLSADLPPHYNEAQNSSAQ